MNKFRSMMNPMNISSNLNLNLVFIFENTNNKIKDNCLLGYKWLIVKPSEEEMLIDNISLSIPQMLRF